MSRTDKDRPYWVRLNDEAHATWHDHEHLGEPVYHYRIVYDAEGYPETVEVPWTMSATDIVKGNPFARMEGRRYFPYENPGTNSKLLQQARELHGAGRGDEQIICGYRTMYRKERYLAYVIADHCTEGEPIDGRSSYYSGPLPCVPEFTGAQRYEFLRNKSKSKHFYSRMHYSHERLIARDTLSRVAREYNTGYDVEDWDGSVGLTNQHRHSMMWDLY